MKKHLTVLLLTAVCFAGYSQNSQNKKESFFKNSYVSGEIIFRSYGTNDIVGFGGGVEVSKDIKKWFGVGLNLSYWDNNRIDWDFFDRFTGERYQYYGRIKEFKVSPFAQIIPVNTKYFDFIIHAGLRTGYYYQNYYLGGYNTSYNPNIFTVDIYDVGYKGFNIGYEFGPALRFQIGRFIIVPSMIYSNDANANDYTALNLKLGWQL